jgi:hypothetical protein
MDYECSTGDLHGRPPASAAIVRRAFAADLLQMQQIRDYDTTLGGRQGSLSDLISREEDNHGQ